MTGNFIALIVVLVPSLTSIIVALIGSNRRLGNVVGAVESLESSLRDMYKGYQNLTVNDRVQDSRISYLEVSRNNRSKS